MATPSEMEGKIRSMIEKMHSHVDALFNMVESMIGERVDFEDELEERLMAVEELRANISRETLLYIARWQPLGRDLTRAEGYIQASYDLYRIARYLREIAKLNRIAGPLIEQEVEIEPLIKSQRMVELALRALLSADPEISSMVEEADKEIDDYYEASIRGLSGEYVSRKQAIQALFARHVERIADHATYIAKLSKSS